MRDFLFAAAFGVVAFAAPASAQDFDPMSMADGDQDGKVTLEEFSGFQEMGWGFFANGAEEIKMDDAPDMAKGALKDVAPNANGVVTHAAYTASIPERFKKADKDANGTLSAEELRSGM